MPTATDSVIPHQREHRVTVSEVTKHFKINQPLTNRKRNNIYEAKGGNQNYLIAKWDDYRFQVLTEAELH